MASDSDCGCGARAGTGVGRVNPGREGECGIVTFAVGSGGSGGGRIPVSKAPFSRVSYAMRAMRLLGGAECIG